MVVQGAAAPVVRVELEEPALLLVLVAARETPEALGELVAQAANLAQPTTTAQAATRVKSFSTQTNPRLKKGVRR